MLKDRTKLPVACTVAGFIGSMTNTILVMGSIYLLYGQSYAEAKNMGIEALFGVIAGIVGMNGIPEAITAAVITAVICPVLLKALSRQSA